MYVSICIFCVYDWSSTCDETSAPLDAVMYVNMWEGSRHLPLIASNDRLTTVLCSVHNAAMRRNYTYAYTIHIIPIISVLPSWMIIYSVCEVARVLVVVVILVVVNWSELIKGKYCRSTTIEGTCIHALTCTAVGVIGVTCRHKPLLHLDPDHAVIMCVLIPFLVTTCTACCPRPQNEQAQNAADY